MTGYAVSSFCVMQRTVNNMLQLLTGLADIGTSLAMMESLTMRRLSKEVSGDSDSILRVNEDEV